MKTVTYGGAPHSSYSIQPAQIVTSVTVKPNNLSLLISVLIAVSVLSTIAHFFIFIFPLSVCLSILSRCYYPLFHVSKQGVKRVIKTGTYTRPRQVLRKE